jgi:hypothetical protein
MRRIGDFLLDFLVEHPFVSFLIFIMVVLALSTVTVWATCGWNCTVYDEYYYQPFPY